MITLTAAELEGVQQALAEDYVGPYDYVDLTDLVEPNRPLTSRAEHAMFRLRVWRKGINTPIAHFRIFEDDDSGTIRVVCMMRRANA